MHGARLIRPIVLMAPLMAGCEVPHNDTLLFSTQTKLAIDISSAPEQGQVPELTIGYKRKEAVWMPLLVNARHSAVLRPGETAPPEALTETAALSTPSAAATPVAMGLIATPADRDAVARSLADYKYRGRGETDSEQGFDSYSVFASFGAQFEGAGAAAEVEAGGGVAQFFATGVAAQRLAKSPQVEELVRVKAPSEQQLEAAERRAAEAEANLTRALGEERFRRLTREQIDQELELEHKRGLIVGFVTEEGGLDESKLGELLNQADIEAGDRTYLEGATTPPDLSTKLTNTPEATEALFKAYVKQTISNS